VSEAVEQLAAVLGFQRRAGRCLFLLAATTENVEELRAVVGAVRADLLLVVCLTAPAEIVTARLAVREADRRPAKLDLIARARTLAHTIPRIEGIDVVIDTEAGDPHEVAVQIRNAMRLYRLLSGATRPS
jgi:chloramphenicol 3-O-phosphotransferase